MHLENGRTSWVEINRSRQWFQYPCLAVRHTDGDFLNFWEEFRNYACVQFLLLPFCLRRCHFRSATHIASPPRPLSTGKGFHSYFITKIFLRQLYHSLKNSAGKSYSAVHTQLRVSDFTDDIRKFL